MPIISTSHHTKLNGGIFIQETKCKQCILEILNNGFLSLANTLLAAIWLMPNAVSLREKYRIFHNKEFFHSWCNSMLTNIISYYVYNTLFFPIKNKKLSLKKKHQFFAIFKIDYDFSDTFFYRNYYNYFMILQPFKLNVIAIHICLLCNISSRKKLFSK